MDEQALISEIKETVEACPGVSRLVSPLMPGRSVKLSKNGGTTGADVYIKAAYGENIPKLSWTVQERIIETIEKNGGRAAGINIHVQGVER